MPAKTDPIARFRHFSRFYTALLGLLDDKLLHSPMSLAQGRLLFEIGARPDCTAGEMGRALGMDRGQLSRTLAGLERTGLLVRVPHPGTAAPAACASHPAGIRVMATLERRSASSVASLLTGLDQEQRGQPVPGHGRDRIPALTLPPGVEPQKTITARPGVPGAAR
jgi:DNA-binding MarR family transcriptional regulator